MDDYMDIDMCMYALKTCEYIPLVSVFVRDCVLATCVRTHVRERKHMHTPTHTPTNTHRHTQTHACVQKFTHTRMHA